MQGRRRPDHRRIVMGLIGIALAFALLFFWLTWLENRDRKPEARGDLSQRYADETVTLNDVAYRKRPNVTAILLLGIDRPTPTTDEIGDYHSGGNADFLRLIVMDGGEKRVSQLQIDRDTVVPVTTLNLIGERKDTQPLQIALSHSYGDGREQSCELTAEAVSRLLLDTPITAYAAVSLDAIAVLNDFVGGVTVPITDDFTPVDPAMEQGKTLRLTGKQAEYFVRSRTALAVDTNEARMARQQVYLSRLTDIIRKRLENDPKYIDALLDALAPYLVTNLTRAKITDLAYRVRDYEKTPLIQIPGAHAIGSAGYMEFHPDEEALFPIVTELFYRQAD